MGVTGMDRSTLPAPCCRGSDRSLCEVARYALCQTRYRKRKNRSPLVGQ